MAWTRKRKQALMVFRVDFEKAFDSLGWEFLELVIAKLGFGTKWCTWIFGCLRNAQASVLVNGSPTCEFEIQKGLRQGDPLSPFLFILAMEGMHVLTCKAIAMGLFKGVSIGVGVSDEEVSNMANVIGCGAAKFPLKYLGVPATRGGAEMSQFNDLLSLIQDVALSDFSDPWIWSVDASNGYTVASARTLIDSSILDVAPNATRWNRRIPNKVNVFIWKLMLNKLPARVNLDRRDIDVGSILCPICMEDVETANHIFLSCNMAKDLWSLFAKWWEIDILVCANISEWFVWLDDLAVSNKVRSFIDGVGDYLMWHI
nr:RNA-directed DNA polymerase, eukaryota, reverse transcriptase zinc-binding domain protein [Tanacetum cinerariifolium]